MNMLVENLLQALIAGLLVGGIYALISVGMALIFGVMKVINFAQGDFMMLGMYFVFFLVSGGGVLAFLGPAISPIVAAFIAGPVMFALAWVVHWLLVSRVSGDRGGENAQLILTLGIALVIQHLVLIFFSGTPRAVQSPFSAVAWPIHLGDILLLINQARAIVCAIAVLLAAALYLFLDRTDLGRSLRAASDNPIAATYMGIDVDRSHRVAFSIGIGLTAIAGGLMAMYLPFHPYTGLDYIVIMLVAVVLGGLGSIEGAFIGGVIIGLVQQMSTIFIPMQLQNASIFVVFLLVLYLRPQGILGRFSTRV